ncbi:hypothetical protein BUALT_Bualt07G0064700 [Buddleja alternifolia]|uniref:J domain-containing protein n=1 Tax=Buddleja alternifolia TaxID=168488 RepID=A0AAV6XJF2_9LAMI|nr:hypothetical protein BUALT_Bualt07G0064700 [Buddleja alternifolia]
MSSFSSVISTVRAYSVPIFLLVTSLFFQLVVLPRNFPPSHYDVLGIPKYSSIEEVTQAYENITSKWNSSVEVPPTVDLIRVQYAFELLSNQLLKRDYDILNIDEHLHVLEEAKEQHTGKHLSEIDLPLIEAASFDPAEPDSSFINPQNFLSMFEDDKALLLQINSFGSKRCVQFSSTWERIGKMLNGVANTGVVEVGDVQLAVYLAEKKSSGQPFFRSGLPALLAFPPGCKSSGCLHRYEGELSVDAVTDWLTTSILNLPRIPYYSKESMVQNFLVKSKPHQVKVIFISKTGERATPFIRQAAKNYSSYTTFAFAQWKDEDSVFWWNVFGVESAPAIVFLKDPGVEPVVYQGIHRGTQQMLEYIAYQTEVLPQLRNITSMELGCDVQGYSRAGNDTKVWYCAIVAGRPSQELNKMRQTMRRVQEKLANDEETNVVDVDSTSTPAVLALKQKRLTLAWLDGEAQQRYCFFNIQSEESYETCGPRRGISDAARLFIVRYQRNDNVTEEKKEPSRQQNNILHAWLQSDPDPVSTLVAKYNGSTETSEIIKWISQTIKDGDSREIPPFKTKAPELLPEDAGQTWTQNGPKKFISKQFTSGFVSRIYDHLGDPRIGPSLLLGALMSFGLIWLNRNRPAQPSRQNQSNQLKKDEDKPKRRNRRREGSNQLIPPSMTDVEPKDAQQIPLSDSDSE